MLVVVSNYDDANNTINNIFWTGNATAASPSWQVIDGALAPASAQSCAIVAKTTGIEYYVGTSIGLYSATSINGTNTSWFNEGTGMLKTAIIRALAVRPEDNAMAIGTHGNGAFYTEMGNPIAYDGSVDPDPGGGGIGTAFITSVRPTLTSDRVFYNVGISAATRISVQLYNSAGQLLFKEERGYSSGEVSLAYLPGGVYFLRIISSDGKDKYVQKIVKQQ